MAPVVSPRFLGETSGKRRVARPLGDVPAIVFRRRGGCNEVVGAKGAVGGQGRGSGRRPTKTGRTGGPALACAASLSHPTG